MRFLSFRCRSPRSHRARRINFSREGDYIGPGQGQPQAAAVIFGIGDHRRLRNDDIPAYALTAPAADKSDCRSRRVGGGPGHGHGEGQGGGPAALDQLAIPALVPSGTLCLVTERRFTGPGLRAMLPLLWCHIIRLCHAAVPNARLAAPSVHSWLPAAACSVTFGAPACLACSTVTCWRTRSRNVSITSGRSCVGAHGSTTGSHLPDCGIPRVD